MSADTEPRWLEPHEQRAWRAFLSATRLLTDQLDRELLDSAGIPLSYYEILVVLSEAPDRRLRMSEVADLLRYSRSRLSHAVTRLEDAGWVVREPCETDRRGFYAVLTDAGFEALEEAAPRHVEGVRSHLFDQLDDEQVSQLREMSESLLHHLTEVTSVSATLRDAGRG